MITLIRKDLGLGYMSQVKEYRICVVVAGRRLWDCLRDDRGIR